MAYFKGEVSGDAYSNVSLVIGAELDTCTRSGNSVTIRYRVYGYNDNQWSRNGIGLWVNGNKHLPFGGGSNVQTTVNKKYYSGWETQTISVGATTSTADIGVGVSQNWYNPSAADGTVYLTLMDIPVATAPSGLWTSITDLGRTYATLNGGYSSIGDYASYAGYAWDWGTSTSYGRGGNELTGLTPNTKYYYKYTVQNTAGLSSSATGNFTTTGNAPDISSVSTSPSRTGCSFSISVNYDTNDSYSSRKIEYGTSTSYGSSVTGTSISGLQANTKYYYKVSITSSLGRTGTYTGNFTTTGNAPSINNVTVSPSRTGCSFSISADYDTNASLSSRRIEYSTDTSYSSYVTGTSISSLQANTTYNYRVRVTDNFGRTSGWYTGSFMTTGNAPVISNVVITDIKPRSFVISWDVTFDTNAGLKRHGVGYKYEGIEAGGINPSSNKNAKVDWLPAGKLISNIYCYTWDTFDRMGQSPEYYTVQLPMDLRINGMTFTEGKLNSKKIVGIRLNGKTLL